jgi:hypothetical protein
LRKCDELSQGGGREPIASRYERDDPRLFIIIATSVGGRGANPGFPMLGFLTFGGAIVALQRIKCPRCVVRLGQLAMILGVPGLKPQPNFCPYCGVSLDEPRTRLTPGAQPTAVNPIS